jgi:hypothetical protein
MEIELDDGTQTIIATNVNREIRISIDERRVYVNGEVSYGFIVELADDAVMVSLGLVSRIGDTFLRWHERTQSVIITTV